MEPVGSSLLFENGQVRVWEMVLAPGESCQPHSHAHDYLMVYTTPSIIASGAPSHEVTQELDPGAVAFRVVGAGGLEPHTIANTGDAESRHIIVELLGPSAAESAQPIEHNGRGRILPPPAAER